MDKLNKSLILLLIAGIPAAAPPFFAGAPDLCFTAGSVTYRLAANASAADYSVAVDVDALHPDLRVGLVDQATTADFALTDDTGAPAGSACRTAGTLKTVRIVAADQPANIRIGIARNAADADFTLYVYSARVNHFDAAALFALMRHEVAAARVSGDVGRQVSQLR